MSFHFLFMAIGCLSILYINNIMLSIICSVLYLAFYWTHVKNYRCLCITLLCYSIATNMMVEIPSIPQENIVRITQIRNVYVIAEVASQEVILYNLTNINFDDIIQIEGDFERIEGIHNEGEFHFPTWASHKGIYYSMNVTSYFTIEEGSTIRHNLFQYLQEMPSDVSDWLKMMLFQIHDDDKISYMALSSGMHLQVLVSFLTSLGTLILTSTTVSMLMILFVGSVGLSTIMSVSIKRILCSKLVYLCLNDLSTKDRLGLEILVLLLLFPSMRYELAFILPLAYRFLYIFNVHHVNRWIVSFLLMIPIQFYFYQSIDIIQIFCFPIFRLFYGICYGFALLLLCFPFLSFLCIYLKQLQHTTYELNEKFPKFYYLPSTIWLFLWFSYVYRYWNTKNNKNLYKFILLLMYSQFNSYVNPFFTIMTIDVGQGDCTLFILPFHQGAMLLDVAGNMNKNIPEDIIVPILRKRGIHSLDKVIITHDDFDHSGGLTELQKYIPVDEIITQKQERINLGPLPISVPLYNFQYDTSNDNSIILFLDIYKYTMLFMGDAGHASEKDMLKEYPNLKVDILKIGHHGSKHSSLPEFIHQLDPRLALISCGRHNRYGHPDKTVMQTLEKEEVYPLNTAVQGSSTFYFSKFISFYKTADGEFGIIENR